MRWLCCVFVALICSFANANSFYPLASASQRAQLESLFQDLRCLVCQNQNLADSNAGLAKDLREQVYQLVKAGKSDEDVRLYLSSRYGDFIFFKPPLKAITYLLWFGPFLFLVLGCILFWRSCLQRSPHE